MVSTEFSLDDHEDFDTLLRFPFQEPVNTVIMLVRTPQLQLCNSLSVYDLLSAKHSTRGKPPIMDINRFFRKQDRT